MKQGDVAFVVAAFKFAHAAGVQLRSFLAGAFFNCGCVVTDVLDNAVMSLMEDLHRCR